MFDLGILKSVKFRKPVIAIGNLTAGGTGKTPHTEYLADMLRRDDYKVAVLSRGYKRTTDHFILAKVKSRVSRIGDEPLQIKQKFPGVIVAVDKNRVRGIKTLTEIIPKLDCIILDDAFQHRYVKAGLSILLIDYNKPIFDDVLLPAGNLREPQSGIRRAEILIVTKCPYDLTAAARGGFISKLHPSGKPEVFFTRYRYGPLKSVFKGKDSEYRKLQYRHLSHEDASVMLVTGIANPAPLKQFIEEYVRIADELTFPDHHNFSKKDIQLMKLKFEAISTPRKFILTTEKDAVRLREIEIRDKKFRKAFYYVPISVEFLDKEDKLFEKRITRFLKKSR